jgi:GntR family transcriptional regulator/MocR family aminotransferase
VNQENHTMAQPPAPISLAALPLDPQAALPLHRQLYNGLRDAILRGQLPGDTKLPGTRTLAAELGVSRNTVLNAFEQLLAEGYITGKVGAGTYVACCLPDTMLQVDAERTRSPAITSGNRRLSERGIRTASVRPRCSYVAEQVPAFQCAVPALDAFPYALWSRLTSRRWRNPPPALSGYGPYGGYWPLREAIAAYLQTARGVVCTAEQVIIVNGSQHALTLAAHMLLDAGDSAWLENPGFGGVQGALRGAGAKLVPVPVDSEGLDVAAGIQRAPDARLIYVSPSHQYPTGVVMSLSRRLSLLEWAAQAGAWVLEDDYDSEFRYSGRPLSALQGLDRGGQVIYIGTFSKVLLPSLRIGYLVVPSDLVDPFITARILNDCCAPTMVQAVLTDFIIEGHFEHHLRRMRTLYAERQQVLVEAARRELAGLIDLEPCETGLHLIGWLPDHSDDTGLMQLAEARGLETRALSGTCIEPVARRGLLLGYGAVDEATIRAGVTRLARVLEEWHST